MLLITSYHRTFSTPAWVVIGLECKLNYLTMPEWWMTILMHGFLCLCLRHLLLCCGFCMIWHVTQLCRTRCMRKSLLWSVVMVILHQQAFQSWVTSKLVLKNLWGKEVTSLSVFGKWGNHVPCEFVFVIIGVIGHLWTWGGGVVVTILPEKKKKKSCNPPPPKKEKKTAYILYF